MKITPIELKALGRFRECCEDSAAGGHDVPKEMMQRLAVLGAVRVLGFGRHETTEFGDWIMAQPPAAGAQVGAKPTEISQRLREYAGNSGYSHNDYADTMRAAADEIERYYGGMLNWKKTAEDKDRALQFTIAPPPRIGELLAAAHGALEGMADSDLDCFETDEEEIDGAPAQYAARKIFEAMQLLGSSRELAK